MDTLDKDWEGEAETYLFKSKSVAAFKTIKY